MLRSKPGIVYAEVLAQRDGDAYTYMVESEVGVDIRKSLFYTLAEKKWPLVGMEAMGMSLEDIFIAVVDQSAAKANRYERKTKNTSRRNIAENEMAKSLVENAGKSKGDGEGVSGEFSALFGDDDNDK